MELPYRSPLSSSSLNLSPRSRRIVADSPHLLHDLSPAICYRYLRPRSDTPFLSPPSSFVPQNSRGK